MPCQCWVEILSTSIHDHVDWDAKQQIKQTKQYHSCDTGCIVESLSKTHERPIVQNYNASLKLRPTLVKVTNFDSIFYR